MEYLKLLRGDLGLFILFMIAREKQEMGIISRDDYIKIMDSLEKYTEKYILHQSVSGGKVRDCYENAVQYRKE